MEFFFEGVRTFAGEGLDKCGDNLSTSVGGGTYTLSINVIDLNDDSGRSMTNFYYDPNGLDAFPWSGYRGIIQAVEIGDGVETISGDAFRNMNLLETVSIPKSVYYIGLNAFLGCSSLTDVYYDGTKAEWDHLVNVSGYLGFSSDSVTVHYLGGMGITFDKDNMELTVNTLAPLPHKNYKDVSAYTTRKYDTIPGEVVTYKYSEGTITYYHDGSDCDIFVYEKWTYYGMDTYVENFNDDTRYHYTLAFDMMYSGFSDEEIKNMKFDFPNIDFDYTETIYNEETKVLYFYASYLNGIDEYESTNRGEVTLDLRDGNVLEYSYGDMGDETTCRSIVNGLIALNDEGKIILEQIDSKTIYLDLDKDGNDDVVFLVDGPISSIKVKVYAIYGCSVNGEVKLSLSNESIIKQKALQNDFGFFDKINFVFDENEEEVTPSNPEDKDEDKNDTKSDAPLHKKGEKISDKKYTYVVTKGETLGVTSLPEVKVTGLKKKSLKQIKIATEVTIDNTTYMVTAIDKNAFKGNKRITKVTIGKNVKSIGKNAFAGDKKLSKVIVKSKKLKKVGKNAFARKGGRKITFRVPKAKKKAYSKLLKKAKTKRFVVK